MAYTLKYTSSRDTWGGAVKSGESFTVDQNTNAPNGRELYNYLKNKLGRTVPNFSELGGGGLDVGESVNFNEWEIERVK